MNSDNRFYRVTRSVTNQGGRLRLTEIYITGYLVGGKEKIIACCGRSAPYTPSRNAVKPAA